MSSECNSVVVIRESVEERGELLKNQVMSGGGTLSKTQKRVRVLPRGIRWGDERVMLTIGASVCMCVQIWLQCSTVVTGIIIVKVGVAIDDQ